MSKMKKRPLTDEQFRQAEDLAKSSFDLDSQKEWEAHWQPFVDQVLMSM